MAAGPRRCRELLCWLKREGLVCAREKEDEDGEAEEEDEEDEEFTKLA